MPEKQVHNFNKNIANLLRISLFHILILLNITINKFLNLDSIYGAIFAVRYLKKKEQNQTQMFDEVPRHRKFVRRVLQLDSN